MWRSASMPPGTSRPSDPRAGGETAQVVLEAEDAPARRRGCPRTRRRRRGSRDRAPRPARLARLPRWRRRSRPSSDGLLLRRRELVAREPRRDASAARTARAARAAGSSSASRTLGAAIATAPAIAPRHEHRRRHHGETGDPLVAVLREARAAAPLDLASERASGVARRGGREGVEARSPKRRRPPARRRGRACPRRSRARGRCCRPAAPRAGSRVPSALSSTAMRPPRAAVRKTVSPRRLGLGLEHRPRGGDERIAARARRGRGRRARTPGR